LRILFGMAGWNALTPHRESLPTLRIDLRELFSIPFPKDRTISR
jgi:hypothetical protein